MKKLCTLLLFLLLFISAVQAQVARNVVYEINDFSKLLQSLVSPYLIKSNAAVEARNVRANKVFGALSKRNEMLEYGSIGAFAVTGLHRFYKSDDTKYLIAGGATYLKYGNDDTGVFTTLRDQLTDGVYWDCVTYMDAAICTNGMDNAQKWDGETVTTNNIDGARTINILTTDLGAPFAELDSDSGGNDLDASKWYQYKTAFYNGTTYKYSTARTNPILTGEDVYTYLKCNDDAANTTVTDAGSGTNTGISSVNTSTLSVTGKISKAFDFSGGNYSININDVASNIDTDTTGSFSLWFNPNSTSSCGYIISFTNNAINTLFAISHLNNKMIFHYDPDEGGYMWRIESSSISNNEWHHVAIIQDGTAPVIYIDGVEDTGATFTASVDKTQWFNSATAKINRGSLGCQVVKGGNQNYGTVIVDDIRYYKDTLNLADIQSIYNDGDGSVFELAQNIALTDIPLGVSGTTHRYIYRTLDNSSRANVEADTTFYKIATIANNSATTHSDAMSDATAAGDAAPTWATVSAGVNVTPPICKYSLIHNERLWAANNSSGKSNIYWSQAYLPNYFISATDYEQIRPDDGDEITFLENLLGNITIGKNNSIQKFLTDAITSTGAVDTNRWKITDPFSIIGTASPRSVQVTPLGILYLGLDGIYSFNGERSQVISEIVTPEIQDISSTNIEKTASVFFNNEYQLAYTSSKDGSGHNDKVLILDTLKDSYVIDDKDISIFTVFNSGSDSGTIYSGSSSTDGKILAHSENPPFWTLRYKSELNEGTTDSVIIYGTEILPFAEIGWGITINDASMAGVTIDSAVYAGATIDRAGLTGTWTSVITEINATDLDKLYWNEELGAYGDITFAIRLGATESAVSSASWSSEFSIPSGTDISGETANDYIQLRASFLTTDVLESPLLYQNNNYVIKLAYSKEGENAEVNIYSVWKSGYSPLGVGGQPSYNPKRLTRIIVYYEGTEGTLTVGYKNSDGDIDSSFDIDLSMLPADDDPYGDNHYTGNDIEKIYTYYMPINQTGEMWQFSITDTGTTTWTVNKIKVLFDVDEML